MAPFLLFAFVPYSQGYGEIQESAFKQLLNLSVAGEDWLHCLFVLPLTMAVFVHCIYQKPLPAPSFSWLGMAFVILAFGMFWAGQRMDTHYVGFFALQAMVAGSIWFLFGWQTVLFFGFPLLFLVFAWPVPFLDNYIAFPLRMLMSRAAVFSLDLIGVDVVRSGTGILSAPDQMLGISAGKKFAVDVANPCSGIRSLFSLTMASAFYANFTLRIWWQKWLLFFCSAPLAIAGNLARILMLTLGTIIFGSDFAIGKNALSEPSWFHMFAGILVFIVAIGGMISIAKLIVEFPSVRTRVIETVRALRTDLKTSVSSSAPRPPPPPGAPAKKIEDNY
jgi:exosortase